MSEEPETVADYVFGYWDWIRQGWAAPLKILWTGLLITEASLLKPAALFFTLFGGFIIREIYMMVVDPYYEGHWIWDKMGGENQ